MADPADTANDAPDTMLGGGDDAAKKAAQDAALGKKADGSADDLTDEEKAAAEAEKKAAEEKAAAEAAKAAKPTGAPESYEAFAIPEGLTVTDAQITDFSAVAKELNLTQEQAQQLVNFEGARMMAFQKEQTEAWVKQEQQWKAQADADPEIGGENKLERIAVAVRAVNRLGGEALRTALNETRAGNHPEIIRAFYRMGKAMSEDNFDFAGTPGGEAAAKDPAEILYGKH